MAQVKLGHVEETSDQISSHLGWGFTLTDEKGVVRVTVSYSSRQDAEQGRKEMGRVLSTATHIVFS
jgi:hypothetical protein